MADKKISQLTPAVTTSSGDKYPLVQGGVTKQIDFTDIIASLPTADALTKGLLSAADWATFNNKQAALSIGTIDSAAKSANGAVLSGASLVMQTADATNVGLVSTGTQTFSGNKTIVGESAATGNALTVNNSTPATVLSVANQGRIEIKQDASVATQNVAVIRNSTSNSGLVLAPNGTGAIMASVPDGTGAGGNARGNNAVDLQSNKNNPTFVASGNSSVIIGGEGNRATSSHSVVLGGRGNSATGTNSIVGGYGNTASGNLSVAIGGGLLFPGDQNTASGDTAAVIGGVKNTASATYSFIAGGEASIAYLRAQFARASGQFAAASDAQTSAITLRREITGTAQTELFLNGSSARAILNIASPGPTNARAWRGQIDVVAIVATAGGGGLVQNECFMGSYLVGIKREGANTSLVGAVGTVNEVSDTNMATSVVTIDADDTNEALRIQFTPPSTADGSTVIRVVATAYLTEVGR